MNRRGGTRWQTAIIWTVAALCLAGGIAVADEHEGEKSAFTKKGLNFETEDGQFSMQVGSRVQFRLTHDDPDGGDSTSSFRVRRAKFSLKGRAFEHWKYKIQAVWSGGSTTLEDAYFQYTKNKAAQVWLGQGKVLFGRQLLTSSGSQQFVDRSITSGRFAPSRDQGVALIGSDENQRFEYNLGVYNGNGRNQSSNDNDEFLYTGRFVYTPLGTYKLEESALDYPESSKLAIGVKALVTNNPEATSTTQEIVPDGFGGFDLVDVTTVSAPEADVSRYGAEFAYKLRGFNAGGEYFTEELEPVGSSASIDTDGFWIQLAYLFPNKKFEVAGRYATVSPDVTGPSVDDIETGVAFSYYIQKHKYKFQADVRELEDEGAGTKDNQVRAQFQWSF